MQFPHPLWTPFNTKHYTLHPDKHRGPHPQTHCKRLLLIAWGFRSAMPHRQFYLMASLRIVVSASPLLHHRSKFAAWITTFWAFMHLCHQMLAPILEDSHQIWTCACSNVLKNWWWKSILQPVQSEKGSFLAALYVQSTPLSAHTLSLTFKY